jgi:hypothetical protein
MPDCKTRRSWWRWAVPCAAVLTMMALAAPAALAWGDATHELITGEAVARLPDPLRGLFTADVLKRLKAASIAADARREKLKAERSPEYAAERAKHYLDIDAITTSPPPFADFPHDRKAAEAKFGAEPFLEHGTVPWSAEESLTALTGAMTRGDLQAIIDSGGDLAHFVADMHMPLHVSKNFNGKLTGNEGIHKMLEVGLVNRYFPFYAAEVAKGRTEPAYLADPVDRFFDWIVKANSRVAPILEADTAARKATGYEPPASAEEFDKELDNLNAEGAKRYYAALKKELEARGSPEAAAMQDAAAHLADVLYTAWTSAGKPKSFAPVAAAPAEEKPMTWVWLLPMVAVLVIVLLRPRRSAQP